MKAANKFIARGALNSLSQVAKAFGLSVKVLRLLNINSQELKNVNVKIAKSIIVLDCTSDF